MARILKDLLEKPEKPTKIKKKKRRKDLWSYISLALQNIVNDVPLNATLVCEYDDIYFEYFSPETDEEFSKRLSIYEEQLKKYNEWYEKNKENIKATLEFKERQKIKHKNLHIKNLETKKIEKL